MSSRHSQKSTECRVVCLKCAAGDCTSCADALLAKIGRHAYICKCRAGAHNDAYQAAVEQFLRGGPTSG